MLLPVEWKKVINVSEDRNLDNIQGQADHKRSTVLGNVGNSVPVSTAQHPSSPEPSATPL
jgi:hypothetical protein